MKKGFIIFILSLLTISSQKLSSQTLNSFDAVADSLRKINFHASESRNLVTGRGFNVYIQRKVFTYLAGSSEVSLSQAYAAYTSENDKLTFGFNIPSVRSGRLASLFNPMIETNVKNNFATLYKKKQWQADIRLGFKWSYLLPFSSINYYPFGTKNEGKITDQSARLIKKRADIIQGLLEKVEKEKKTFEAKNPLLDTIIRKKMEELSIFENNLNKMTNEDNLKSIDHLKIGLENLKLKDPVSYKKKMFDYERELAKSEADALAEKNAYTWMQTSWISFWGFYPLTEKDYYLTPANTQSFHKLKFHPWELNGQFNYLIDGRPGSVFVTVGYKVFQNNNALADLMTSVDYNQFLQLPGIDTLKAAILQTNKGYIGNYDEFVTNNLNFQIVLTLSSKKDPDKEQVEKFITPGISFRYEKNFGVYRAINLSVGLPFRFRGKDKAVNIEPQLRWNNVSNYAGKVNYKVQPVFGINVGLPFTALFK